MIKDTNNLKALYKEMYHSLPNDYIHDIYPFFVQVGKKYFKTNKKCLFIGKSVNGWLTSSRDVDDFFDMNSDNCIVNRPDQMEWVNSLEGSGDGYNTRKSAFWRVIKNVSKAVCNEEDWFNHIAWSNLYKMSPESGNPSAFLQRVQRESCIKILNEEIKTLKPNFIIFLTSGWEGFFIDRLGLDSEKSQKTIWSDYETIYQNNNGTMIIQSMHPQGKDESSHIEALQKIII